MNKISIALLSIAGLALSGAPTAGAYDFKVNGVYYNYNANKSSAIVTYMDLQNNLEAYQGDVVIPAEVYVSGKTIPVKGVSDHAFFNCQYVNSVVLPESVTYIEEQAFASCYYMTSITIPSKLQRIGDWAFENCEDMLEISLPATLNNFGYAVFTNCKSLRHIDVDEENQFFKSEDGVMYLKDGSMLVQYPASKEGDAYTIPESVTTLTEDAFVPNLNLKTINIGANLGAVKAMTFSDCVSLEAINVDEANQYNKSVDGVLYNADMTTLIQYPSAYDAESYSVPEGVTTMASMSMFRTPYLGQLTLPSTLTRMGDYCLHQVPFLESVTIKATTPPTVGALYNAFFANTYLFVPEESVDAYKKLAPWSDFRQVVAIGQEPSNGLNEIAAAEGYTIDGRTIAATEGTVQVYDLTGRLVEAGKTVTVASAGLYLVRTASGTAKVSIR